MRLNGENLYLRDVRLEDITKQGFIDTLNDSQVNQFLETRFEIQCDDTVISYFKKHIGRRDEPWFAICLNERTWNNHIGNIKLGPVNCHHRRGDISLFIAKSQQGKGYGTEAIKLVRDYAFKVLNLNKICAGIYESNKASIRAFEKADFQQEGILIDHVWSNGSYENLILMGRTRFDS